MSYPTTSTPFTCWERTALAEMATALSSAPVHDGAHVYRDVGDTFGMASALVREAGSALHAGQVGAAAGAVAGHLGSLRAHGMSGQSQALEAMIALVDEGEAVGAARHAIAEAGEFADADVPPGTRLSPAWEAAYFERLARVQHAAVAYENVTNTQYATAFQPYPAPPALAVDAGAVPGGPGGGVGSMPPGVVTAPAGVAPGASGGVPVAPGTAGGGATPGGPGPGSVPGWVAPAPIPGAAPPPGARPPGAWPPGARSGPPATSVPAPPRARRAPRAAGIP
ncbi:MAG: hypothetical protein ACT4RN_10340, partial [Pseudonocardia sp.]